MNRLRQYVEDLLENINAIERFTQDGREMFMADDRTQYAVIRAYEVIGEIVKRIPTEITDGYPEVEWKQISGFRDFLIHRYDEVDLDIVWGAVEKLPTLRAAVQHIASEIEEE